MTADDRYNPRMIDLPQGDRPRERLLARGPAALATAELLAIVLGIFFLAVFAFFRTLGQVGTFPAAIAAWRAGFIFAPA